MSRLTGNDVVDMLEAYNAVYTPQEEISEEQIWEEVEEWVNSLVEEGHDLSEFTWEEMYEAYLSEMGQPGARTTGQNSRVFKTTPGAGSASGQGGGRGSGSSIGGLKPAAAKPSPSGTTSKFAGYRDAAFNKAKAIKGSPVVGSGAKPSPAPAARPTATARPSAAPAAKPASTAAAKPSSAPAAKPAPTAAAKPAAAAPAKTRNPLMDKTFGYQTGNAPDQQQARADKIVQSGAVKALAPSAAKPTPKPTPAATGSKKPGSVYSSFDMFDVVKGHLIGEGYADTEEAAIAIMANMSEEWKASIISEDSRRTSNKQHTARVKSNIKAFGSNYTPPRNYDPNAGPEGKGEVLTRKQIEKKRRKALAKGAANEEFELWVNALVEEGYDLSDYTWDEMYEFYLDEGEKPFPHEKVRAKQVALRDKGGNALDRRMRMGMAVRRAKEAEKTGGSQKDAGKGWYHGR